MSRFASAAGVDGNLVQVRWVIADGYYLYRQRIEIKPESPDLVLRRPMLPQGVLKVDPYLGSQQIYQQQVEATVPFTRSDAGAHPLQIKVTYQGCAEAGLCYPPITKVIFPSRARGAGHLRVASLGERRHIGRGFCLSAGGAAATQGTQARRSRRMNSPLLRAAGAALLVAFGIWAGIKVHSARIAASNPSRLGGACRRGQPAEPQRFGAVGRRHHPSAQDSGPAAAVLARGQHGQAHLHHLLRRQILDDQLLGDLVRALPQRNTAARGPQHRMGRARDGGGGDRRRSPRQGARIRAALQNRLSPADRRARCPGCGRRLRGWRRRCSLSPCSPTAAARWWRCLSANCIGPRPSSSSRRYRALNQDRVDLPAARQRHHPGTALIAAKAARITVLTGIGPTPHSGDVRRRSLPFHPHFWLLSRTFMTRLRWT